MSESGLVRDAREIFAAALRECSVDRAFARKVRVVSEDGRTFLQVAQETVDITDIRHVLIVSAGKAGGETLMALLSRVSFHPDCEIQGVLIARHSPAGLPKNFQFFAGGHPLPNEASFEGARAALKLFREAASLTGALCVCLLSGGASAMMELPLEPAISLEDTRELYRKLVHSAAPISEINCIRKHFSAVKGGRLAVAAGGAPLLTLLVADVAPQHLDALASGPTLPDPTTVGDCRELLARYSLEQGLPREVRDYFASPFLAETPKPDDLEPRVGVLLDSDDLAEAARQHAQDLGYRVVVDNSCDDWPYDRAATYLVDRLRGLRGEHERVCLISAGEVTVAVSHSRQHGTHVGGRNQQFALYCASVLEKSDGATAVLSAGSDGIDGNSEAAGAVIGAETLRDREGREQARNALEQFDAFTFLDACGATVVTGPTGNNLRDLRILLADRSSELVGGQ